MFKEPTPGESGEVLVLGGGGHTTVIVQIAVRVVEFYLVQCADGYERERISIIDIVGELGREVPVLRNETETGQTEDEVEVATASRDEE